MFCNQVLVCILFLQAFPLSFTSINIDAFHILLVTMFFPLTIVATGSPGPHSTVQSSIQPQQQPADTEAQQQPQHEVHLLFGHTVTHKVILRRVHERMVSIIWNYVVNMMPRAERGELCLEVYMQQQKTIDGNIKYKMIKKTINKDMTMRTCNIMSITQTLALIMLSAGWESQHFYTVLILFGSN